MDQDTAQEISSDDILRLSVDIVAAYVGHNQISSQQIPEVISTVHGSLRCIDGKAATERLKPAVSVGRSIKPDYIVCLEDGRKMKMLKRHLRTSYGMSPDEYRAKWNLPSDYPMVAPNYSIKRSEFAKNIGLGLKTGKKRKRAGGS